MPFAAADLAALLGDWSIGPGPLHRKLAGSLRAALADGDAPPGARLPAERLLARTLAVSRTTVVAAYDQLAAEGWLERRQGSGTRVSPSAAARRQPRSGHVAGGTGHIIFQRLIDGEGELISLACAINPGSPAVAEALADVAADRPERLLAQSGYVPRGLPVLRRELARYLDRSGLPTAEDQLLITTGAHQALALTSALFVRPGDTVVVESPSFPGCLDVFRAAGARLASVPIDDEGVRPDLLEATVSSTTPALIYLMPTFHNPAGVMLSEYRRRRVVEVAAAGGIPVLEDNALEGASLGETVVPPIATFGGGSTNGPVLTVGSLSKSLWGGLRVGWVRGPRPVIERLVRLKTMADLGSPVFDQAVAARLVPDLEAHIARRAIGLRAGLGLVEAGLSARLPGWRWQRPDGGPALWTQMGHGDSSTFAQVALRHGVEVVPGETMAPDGGHRDRVRIPYCFDQPILEEMIDRLARAWESYCTSPYSGREESLSVVV